MKKFQVTIRRTQLTTVTVEGDTIEEARNTALDPEIIHWYPWDELENVTYKITHINEIKK